VAIAGAGRVAPKGRYGMHPGPIRVAIGAAVQPADHPDRDSLLREVHRRVVELHRSIGAAGAAPPRAPSPGGAEGTHVLR
jgi:hypothetical protein